MAVFALIGIKGLYLMFAWLLSAAIGAVVAERKGYGERLGLAFGLLLTVVGPLDRSAAARPAGFRLEDRGPIPAAVDAALNRSSRTLSAQQAAGHRLPPVGESGERHLRVLQLVEDDLGGQRGQQGLGRVVGIKRGTSLTD